MVAGLAVSRDRETMCVICPPLESLLMDIVVRQRMLLDIACCWLLLVGAGHRHSVISDGAFIVLQCHSLAPIEIQWVSVSCS